MNRLTILARWALLKVVGNFSIEISRTTIVLCLVLATLLFAFSFAAEAQQTKKVARIGFLGGTGRGTANYPRSNFTVMRQALRDLGYIEGQNVLFEYRNAEGKLDLIPKLVDELVQLTVDVLVTTNPTAIRAAKQATKTIPIVMVITQDPVAAGIIDSLAQPGTNVTGLSLLSRDLSGKRLELLQEIVPKISRVGILLAADAPSANSDWKGYEAAARALKVEVQPLEMRGPTPDLPGAFNAVAKRRLSALISVRTSLLNTHAKPIAGLAIKNQLPLMFEASEHVDEGGLVSYANSDAESFRRAAWYLDKILKGAKPADLPVEQPTKFELVINLKTAKQIGLRIPPNVLARADKVIK
jgi:putative tryptophan/tyrosine transport system substrate-binding protein